MRSRRTLVLALIGVALALLLGGCSIQRERSFKIHPDWSKGLVVGFASVRQPVGLAADEQGAYLLWSARQEDSTRLSFTQIGLDGTVVVSRTLPIPTFFPRLPQLVTQEHLSAFLITRLSAAEQNGVYYVPLTREGELLDEPQRLSAPEQRTDSLLAIPGPDGSAELLWDVTDGPGVGVYHLHMRPDGSPDGFAQLIGVGGEQPAGQVDQDGTLHAAWLTPISASQYDLTYTTIEAGSQFSSPPTVLRSLRIPPTDITQLPTLGLDDTHVYVMWTQEHRTGLQQGSAEMSLISFPIGQPQQARLSTVFVSRVAEPIYESTGDFPPLTSLVPPNEEVDWTDFIEGPTVFSSPETQSAVKVLADMSFSFRFEERPQLVLLVFQDGEFVGYQQPARTRQYSQRPRGGIDPRGQLHMAWIDLEEPGNYSVYYAATDPEVKATLDRRTTNDAILDATETVFGVASGFSLIPLFFVTLIPIFAIMGIFYLTGHDDTLTDNWSARLTLIITIIVYIGWKTLVLGGLVFRPPFIELVPPSIQPVWTLVLLLAVALLAGLAVWIYIRRSSRPYLFRATVVFILIDMLLTLVLYAPRFFSE